MKLPSALAVNTFFGRGSITVRPTSCFTCLASATLLMRMLNIQHIYLFGRIGWLKLKPVLSAYLLKQNDIAYCQLHCYSIALSSYIL